MLEVGETTSEGLVIASARTNWGPVAIIHRIFAFGGKKYRVLADGTEYDFNTLAKAAEWAGL